MAFWFPAAAIRHAKTAARPIRHNLDSRRLLRGSGFEKATEMGFEVKQDGLDVFAGAQAVDAVIHRQLPEVIHGIFTVNEMKNARGF